MSIHGKIIKEDQKEVIIKRGGNGKGNSDEVEKKFK